MDNFKFYALISCAILPGWFSDRGLSLTCRVFSQQQKTFRFNGALRSKLCILPTYLKYIAALIVHANVCKRADCVQFQVKRDGNSLYP